MIITVAYLLLLIFVIAICLLLIRNYYLIIFKKIVPYVRSGTKIIDLIIAEKIINDGNKIYDLGCGDGKVLRALEKHGQFKLVGFEYYWVPYFLALILNFLRNSQAQIKRSDFFKADLSDADVVFCYLLPEQMADLENKFKQELKKGALIISNTFNLPNWPLEKEIVVNPNKQSSLSNRAYIYRV